MKWVAGKETHTLADSPEYQLPPDLVDSLTRSLLTDPITDEDVRTDQAKALAAVGRQGILIWHDFTLNPRVVRGQPACVGVIAAIADAIASLTATGRLVCIENTLLLLRLREGATSRSHGTREGASITCEGSADFSPDDSRDSRRCRLPGRTAQPLLVPFPEGEEIMRKGP